MGAGGTAPGTEIEATALAAQPTWRHRSPAEMRWATRLSMEDDCGATDPAREQRCGHIHVVGIRALVAYLPSPEPGPAGSPQSTSRQVRPEPPSGPRFRRTRAFGNMRHCRRLSGERGQLGSSARIQGRSSRSSETAPAGHKDKTPARYKQANRGWRTRHSPTAPSANRHRGRALMRAADQRK